jgi:hypothetical protein
MNDALLPQILLRSDVPAQTDLELATDGVLRYVWRSAFGDMLIEVINGATYVNGQRVEVAPPMRRR